jgi:hypothetical protein
MIDISEEMGRINNQLKQTGNDDLLVCRKDMEKIILRILEDGTFRANIMEKGLNI